MQNPPTATYGYTPMVPLGPQTAQNFSDPQYSGQSVPSVSAYSGQPMFNQVANVPSDNHEDTVINMPGDQSSPSHSPPNSRETSPLRENNTGKKDWTYWSRRILVGKEEDEETVHPYIRKLKKEIRRLLGEFFGTLFLIFFICGSEVIDVFSETQSDVSLLTKGITSGFALCALIYTFGQVSGCHLNPIVTLGFTLRGLFRWWRAPLYIVAQFAGALAAAGILVGIFGNIGNLGATMPAGPPVTIREVTDGQALGMEIVLSCLLVTVVLTTAERSKILGVMSAIAVGSVFTAIQIIGWNVSGASVNPWRSFAPTIISGSGWHTIWIYFAGPIAGMLLAVVGQRIFVGRRRRKEARVSARGVGMTSGEA